jgi:hypothetical protein
MAKIFWRFRAEIDELGLGNQFLFDGLLFVMFAGPFFLF